MKNSGERAALASLERRIGATAARAVVHGVDDENGRQLMQLEILLGELRDAVERFQNYGLTSHPHPGSEAAVLSLGGRREQSIVIAVEDRRYRLVGLEAGEVALYDDLGNRVLLLRDRLRIEGNQRVQIAAPMVAIEADRIIIDGDTTFNGPVTANGKHIDDTHTHQGVVPGSGLSGPPS